MKLLLVLALAGTSLLVLPALAHVPAGRSQPAHAMQLHSTSSSASMAGKTATLVDLRTNGGNTVAVIRQKGGALGSVSLAAAKVLLHDGQTLMLSELRIGDQLTLLSGRRIVDNSQHVAVVRGVVSAAPETENGPMVVVSGARGVVADPSSHTRYVDITHQTAHVVQITDSDLVTVRGVVDDVLGEMTRVTSISRLGPARHPGSGRT